MNKNIPPVLCLIVFVLCSMVACKKDEPPAPFHLPSGCYGCAATVDTTVHNFSRDFGDIQISGSDWSPEGNGAWKCNLLPLVVKSGLWDNSYYDIPFVAFDYDIGHARLLGQGDSLSRPDGIFSLNGFYFTLLNQTSAPPDTTELTVWVK